VEADRKLCSACTAHYCQRLYCAYSDSQRKRQVLAVFQDAESKQKARSVNLSGLHFFWSRQFSLVLRSRILPSANPTLTLPVCDSQLARCSLFPQQHLPYLFALFETSRSCSLVILFYTTIFLADLLCTLCTAYHHSLDLALSISSIHSKVDSKFLAQVNTRPDSPRFDRTIIVTLADHGP
jgi:hypothetical protein